MVDEDTPRPSLETPKLFGRRKPARPAGDDRVFEDSGIDPAAETDVLPVVESAPAPDQTAVLPVAAASTPGGRRPRRVRRVAADARIDDTGSAGDAEGGDIDVADKPVARLRRPSRDASQPLLPGRPAAALTGVLAGLALIGFTWLGFQGCEAARGTTSCGTGPGMVALVVVMVLTIIVGGLLLRLFKIPEPGSTSFLGTGLTGVIYLIVLVDRLEGWPTLIVIPAISAGTYLLSWWVTTTYVSED